METERVGPLSYSLEEPTGEFSAERPIIVGSVVTVVSALPVVAVGWLAHEWVGNRKLLLWLAVAAVFACGLGVAWVLSSGPTRRRRNALAGVALAASIVSFGVHTVLDLSRPTVVQLAYAIDSFDLPTGWTTLSREETGKRSCKPACPKIEIFLRAPADVADPGLTLMRAFFAQGWSQADPNVPPDAATAAVKGLVQADVFTTFGERDVRLVVAQTTARVASG